MSDAMQEMHDRARLEHEREVANGEHDRLCEWRAGGFFLCHCSKRQREAQGYTTPPGELIFHNPSCPRCDDDVEHDGDTWRCDTCRCTWDQSGQDAEFTDEFGDDLADDLAKWEAHHATRKENANA